MLKRRYDPELMDDVFSSDEQMGCALKELRLVNRYLGGKTTTQKGIRLLRNNISTAQPLSVLDLGAGGADVFEDATDELHITALDSNPSACRYVRSHTPYSVVCGDVLHSPVKEEAYDIVHASLFLHHFHEHDIRTILLTSLRSARYGVVLNDLRRSIFAYAGIKLLTLCFSRSALVRHDGPLSVLRGFTRNELRNLLASSGITHYSLRKTWAFRWLVVIGKQPPGGLDGSNFRL